MELGNGIWTTTIAGDISQLQIEQQILHEDDDSHVRFFFIFTQTQPVNANIGFRLTTNNPQQ